MERRIASDTWEGNKKPIFELQWTRNFFYCLFVRYKIMSVWFFSPEILRFFSHDQSEDIKPEDVYRFIKLLEISVALRRSIEVWKNPKIRVGGSLRLLQPNWFFVFFFFSGSNFRFSSLCNLLCKAISTTFRNLSLCSKVTQRMRNRCKFVRTFLKRDWAQLNISIAVQQRKETRS